MPNLLRSFNSSELQLCWAGMQVEPVPAGKARDPCTGVLHGRREGRVPALPAASSRGFHPLSVLYRLSGAPPTPWGPPSCDRQPRRPRRHLQRQPRLPACRCPSRASLGLPGHAAAGGGCVSFRQYGAVPWRSALYGACSSGASTHSTASRRCSSGGGGGTTAQLAQPPTGPLTQPCPPPAAVAAAERTSWHVHQPSHSPCTRRRHDRGQHSSSSSSSAGGSSAGGGSAGGGSRSSAQRRCAGLPSGLGPCGGAAGLRRALWRLVEVC